MPKYVSQHWWLLLLRGIAAIIFGILAWTMPGITLAALVLLFGIYAIVDGVMGIAYSFTNQGSRERWSLLLMGVLGCAAGVVALGWPGITAVALLFVIAFWAIFTGALEIVAAFGVPLPTSGRWLLGLAGVASTAFGVLLAIQPDAGLLTIVWLLGFYGVFYGVLSIVGSFELRGLYDRVHHDLGGLMGAA